MIVAIPKILVDKLGNDGADALIHVLNDAESRTKNDLCTKADLTELKLSMKADLSEVKAELLKWMFIFWVGQAGTMLGILFVFFKR